MTADDPERDFTDVVVWRPIGPPGWKGPPVEGWLQHFEDIVENGLTEGDDINTGWGLGFMQGLVAGFGNYVTPEEADRFGELVKRITADCEERRGRSGLRNVAGGGH